MNNLLKLTLISSIIFTPVAMARGKSENNSANASAGAVSKSVSKSDASASAVAGGSTVYNNTSGSDTPAVVIAPGLSSSHNACMGSSSGGVGGNSFGFTFGTTWQSEHCERMNNVNKLIELGLHASAMQVLCFEPEVKEALEATGYLCKVETQEEKHNQEKTSNEDYIKENL